MLLYNGSTINCSTIKLEDLGKYNPVQLVKRNL